MRISHKYGWNPQRPDQRDFKFVPKLRMTAEPLPSVVDLAPKMPEVYNQGDIGSCTANAIAAAFDYERQKQGLPFMSPSRLFIYANERTMELTPLSVDSGAQIRDGVKSVATLGVCPESEWPYTDFTVQPPALCYTDALKDLALQYQAVDPSDLCATLAQDQPVIIGITVYESFEAPMTGATGVVPMPAAGESVMGGHAVLVVGYDLAAQTFKVRNSWGWTWGTMGYFTIPFAYLTNPQMASDFWTLMRVE
jgi:C1A family cysteine protease